MHAHSYTITSRSYNRTTRAMSAPHRETVQAKSRWGALRAWWRIQRQFQPLVEVLDIALCHVGCPIVEYPTHWEYGCGRY
jgi:hypothetical protein